MTVRLNDYHDLPVIQALYEASGKQPYPLWNWSCNTHGWWLLAEDDARRPLGCIQLYLSQPQAFVDLLCVPEVFSHRLKAQVVKALCMAVLAKFKEFGVRTFTFQVPRDGYCGPLWSRVLHRRGAQYVHPHPTYVMQVN